MPFIFFYDKLILMDIELAGRMDGIDAARKILKSYDIPVVFLTANISVEIIDKIKEVKAFVKTSYKRKWKYKRRYFPAINFDELH